MWTLWGGKGLPVCRAHVALNFPTGLAVHIHLTRLCWAAARRWFVAGGRGL